MMRTFNVDGFRVVTTIVDRPFWATHSGFVANGPGPAYVVSWGLTDGECLGSVAVASAGGAVALANMAPPPGRVSDHVARGVSMFTRWSPGAPAGAPVDIDTPAHPGAHPRRPRAPGRSPWGYCEPAPGAYDELRDAARALAGTPTGPARAGRQCILSAHYLRNSHKARRHLDDVPARPCYSAPGVCGAHPRRATPGPFTLVEARAGGFIPVGGACVNRWYATRAGRAALATGWPPCPPGGKGAQGVQWAFVRSCAHAFNRCEVAQ